jgi:uncharacterized membrane protein YqaE (UPF0057 family)|uniref:Uncharacterized protein n=1 Tax=Mimiviridae sp. ChoanoV1 TaxID=2596887 RepID=A0A5B8HVW7_9VIRU|nr:hypothetical protein 5_46 [Mimiviridae sp. ChoanoV1]
MDRLYISIGIIILSLIGIHVNKEMSKQTEHFAGVISQLPKLFKAIISFFTNFVDLFMVLVDAIINFALSFVDIFMVLVDALTWIGNIPGWIVTLFSNIVNIFIDILTFIVLWLNPITMTRSVIKVMIAFVKIIFVMILDIFIHIFRLISESLLKAFRGGMWGLPHEPKHHLKHHHGIVNPRDIGGFYHHHKHNGDDYLNNHKYKSMRCYRGLTSNGFLNIIGTILCPPAGIFMAFGVSGFFKIVLCAILTLGYYIPGLVYAFLVTSHLGLGTQIKYTDCGGGEGGLVVSGCSKRTTKGLCDDAVLPDFYGKDGSTIPACKWEADINKEYGGTCKDVMFTDEVEYKSTKKDVLLKSNYTDLQSGQYQATEQGGTHEKEDYKKYENQI